MKYLDEYRNPKLVKQLIEQIKKEVNQPWVLMEICGGQTHSLVKNGLLDLLPKEVVMVHGPGCPVCVTPSSIIDKAIYLAEQKNVAVFSFGDMMRVPGKNGSLLEAKANGAHIEFVYSPLDAVKYAEQNPQKEVCFFGVGFETTAPANALAILQAKAKALSNFSMLTSHVLVPPAMEAILADKFNTVKGFLAAGHVCTVMGYNDYFPVAEKYQAPIVVTGFEPVDLLQGILSLIKMLQNNQFTVKNEYGRVVTKNGNPSAMKIINEVFELATVEWRGIGFIPESGLAIKSAFSKFDANKKFEIYAIEEKVENGCKAGDILRGKIKPNQCPFFGKECTPRAPMGAPMVSSEGACAAYFNFKGVEEEVENA